MKIALVLASPPGYSETFFNSLIKGLKANGHDVILYTGYSNTSYNACKHIKHPSVHKNFLIQILVMLYKGLTLLGNQKAVRTYFFLEKADGTSLKRILEKLYLNASLLKFKGDWIHFGFATTAIDRELVAQAVGAKMAVSLRGYDMNVYPLKHAGCYDLLWRQADKVHSISRHLLERAYSLGLQTGTAAQVIYPAVYLKDLPQASPGQKRPKLKIVTVARFNWVKGLDLLTEVASVLKEKGLLYEWLLIGEGDAEAKERFLFDVYEKKLQGYIIHKGMCSHEETLITLNTCDVYVQTSLIEGFCNALLEAQALGIPCIAFNTGGIPENIVNNKTGWLIEPYNVPDMANRIESVNHMTAADKKSMSEAAINRIQKHFNLESQQQAFNEFYRF